MYELLLAEICLMTLQPAKIQLCLCEHRAQQESSPVTASLSRPKRHFVISKILFSGSTSLSVILQEGFGLFLFGTVIRISLLMKQILYNIFSCMKKKRKRGLLKLFFHHEVFYLLQVPVLCISHTCTSYTTSKNSLKPVGLKSAFYVVFSVKNVNIETYIVTVRRESFINWRERKQNSLVH